MLDKSFVEKIESMSVPTHLVFDDIHYSDKKLHKIQVDEPNPLVVYSLKNLVAFVLDHHTAKDDFMVHVEDSQTVRVYSRRLDDNNRRLEFCQANCSKYVTKFKFDHRYEQEQFIINAQAGFVLDEMAAKVIDIASRVSVEESEDFSDDGFTQEVSAKAGVTLMRAITIPNPVSLKPFKSFAEIEPVEQSFVFRVHKSKNSKTPTFALYEADTARWELAVMDAIRAYLTAQMPDIVVV